MIMRYINMDFAEHDNILGKKVDQNENYKAAVKDLHEALKSLDRKTEIHISDKACFVEAIVTDIAYDEGFKEGIKFILGCISSGEVFQHE